MSVPHNLWFAHTLQLGVNDSLKIPSIAKALGASQRLVAHFNHSVLATDGLRNKQLQMDSSIAAKNVIHDCPTRWNSGLQMMKRLLELCVPIYAVLIDDSLTKSSERGNPDIDDVFWNTM